MKTSSCSFCHRRQFLSNAMMGSAAFFTVKGAFAEALIETPTQTEGPFYPDSMPLDTDNDLIVINDNITPAVGEITHLKGKVTDLKGNPVPDALVEIWQVDMEGNYIHSRGGGRSKSRDTNFQGYGRSLTAKDGEYYFRTIKPRPYGPRTPHIHLAVSRKEERILTTQIYVKGHPRNLTDFILQRTPADTRQTLISDFQPIPDSATGELSARFDIVLGLTPAD